GVQMPTRVFPFLFVFGNVVVGEGAVDQSAVAHGPITVDAQTFDGDRHYVSGHRALNVEWPRKRVTADDALRAFFILAARIATRCMNGIARPDAQDGLCIRGELSIEVGWDEIEGAGRRRFVCRGSFRAPGSRGRLRFAFDGIVTGHADVSKLAMVRVRF